MYQYKKLKQKLSKEIKSDNFCLSKVGSAIITWGAVLRSQIILWQCGIKITKDYLAFWMYQYQYRISYNKCLSRFCLRSI